MGRREHLGTEAVYEPSTLDLPEVAGGDTAMRGEPELLLLVVPEEDPARSQAETLQDLVERYLEHADDGVLALKARGDSREDDELALALADRVLEMLNLGSPFPRDHLDIDTASLAPTALDVNKYISPSRLVF
jgi:hypothetical protein